MSGFYEDERIRHKNRETLTNSSENEYTLILGKGVDIAHITEMIEYFSDEHGGLKTSLLSNNTIKVNKV